MKLSIKVLLDKIIILYLFIPITGLFLFSIGLELDLSILYSILILFLFLINLFLRKTKRESIFFTIISLSFLLNATLFILNFGLIGGVVESLKAAKNYYSIFFIGFIVYYFYIRTGNENVFLNKLVKIGIFISVFNIVLAIDTYINVIGLYSTVKEYIKVVYPSYEGYLNSYVGIKRPMGYFFDLHSQYYLPLATLFILLYRNNLIKWQSLAFFIVLIAVVLSGVRMAYATLAVFFVFSLFQRKRSVAFWIVLFLTVILSFVLLYDYIFMFYGQITGQSGESANIIFQHLFSIPGILIEESFITFLYGGNSEFRTIIYSEIYLWSLIFYIGIIGLVFYFLPLIQIIDYKRYKLGFFITSFMLFSLLHYKVYNSGVNIFLSSLGVAYFFDFFSKLSLD